MIIYESANGYSVTLDVDGDDLWISVTNGYCASYDCIVGTVDELNDANVCVTTAYYNFFPSQYVEENLQPDDDRYRVFVVAKDAFEIDRALEMAMKSVA